jgi:hypothetical protein
LIGENVSIEVEEGIRPISISRLGRTSEFAVNSGITMISAGDRCKHPEIRPTRMHIILSDHLRS